MRLTRTSVALSFLYVVLGLAWVFGARPPGQVGIYAAWFVVVAAVGAFVPGLANQVSLARAYLAAPALAYSVSGDRLGLLALVLAIAGLTDLVDGTIARRFDKPSTLGGGLDPVVDGILLGSVGIGLVVGGVIPSWLAAVIVLRYLVPAVTGFALISMGYRPELRHTVSGQISTALIIVLVGGICLFRFFNQDASNVVAGAEIFIPLTTVATFIHLGWAARRRRPVAAPGAG